MKQIIDNVLYDTEKAEFITNYYVVNCKRELYRTKSDPFKFFAIVWDYFDRNSNIEKKDEEFVKTLLGKINIEKYIELFGAPEEA